MSLQVREQQIIEKVAARRLNEKPQFLTDAELKKLKAELKKCTSFVNKLRAFQDTHTDSVIKDVKTLRLTKYITEAIPALAVPVLKVRERTTFHPARVYPSAAPPLFHPTCPL